MDIDGQDWEGGIEDPFGTSLDEDAVSFDDDSVGHLTLGDGDGDSDGDGDGDSDEEDMECLGKLLENALKNIVSKLNPQQRIIIEGTILQYALPQGGLSQDYYKGFYMLLTTRNKQTGVPLYNASANYKSAPPQQQQLIQTAINNWDQIAIPALWNDLAEAVEGPNYKGIAAMISDLILGFQFAEIYDDALHNANNQFIQKWTSANFGAFCLQLAAQFSSAEDINQMCSYMSSYQVSGIGQPPFALGAQAVLIAYSIVLGYTTASEIQKCLEGGE